MKELEEMSAEELVDLKTRIDTLLKTRKAEASNELLAEFREKAESLGIDFDVLVGKSKKKKSSTKRVPKYRNPENSSETWTGQGRQPNWVKTYLDQGKDLKDIAI